MREKNFTTEDGFTFEPGKSYFMKYKRTIMRHVYEKEGDWYRVERVTSKTKEVTGYVNDNQLASRYNYFKHLGGGKIECREMTADEIKQSNADYNTWEEMENQKREEKRKAYAKKNGINGLNRLY